MFFQGKRSSCFEIGSRETLPDRGEVMNTNWFLDQIKPCWFKTNWSEALKGVIQLITNSRFCRSLMNGLTAVKKPQSRASALSSVDKCSCFSALHDFYWHKRMSPLVLLTRWLVLVKIRSRNLMHKLIKVPSRVERVLVGNLFVSFYISEPSVSTGIKAYL